MSLKDLIVRGPMPKPKAKKQPAISPIEIDDVTWMYPLQNGLTVVHEFRVKGQLMRSDTFVIKWVDVGSAMERRKAFRKPYPKRS